MTSNTDSTYDDRIAPRVEKDTTVFVELTTGSVADKVDSDIVICKTVNLSTTGVQVVLDREISKGCILRLCLDTKGWAPIFVVAKAMWQRQDLKTQQYYVGFMILESSGTDFADWQVVVAKMFDS